MSDFIPDVEDPQPPSGDFGLPAQRNPYGGNGQMVERPSQPSSLAAIEEARAIGELKAQIMLAQMYPRDEQKCMDTILNDCGRLSVADGATYRFPRGNQQITGPSIKLLEAIARRWRNMNTGWKVIYQDDEHSEVVAYCWDKETNEEEAVRFPVPHYRWASGKKVKLVDPRDIYEAVANVAQRRKRACMQHIIPAEVVSAAVAACEQTLAANVDISAEGLKRLLTRFAEFNVTQQQIEQRLRCRLSAISPGQYLQLRGIYAALKDGVSPPEAWFGAVEPEPRPTQAQSPVAPYPPSRRGTTPDPMNPPTPVPPPPPPAEPPAPPANDQPPAEPPPAAAAPEEPPLDGNGNGEVEERFEGMVLDHTGDPIDGEVIGDPLHYAQAILKEWEASEDRAAFLFHNERGIELACKADPQADALLDGIEAEPAGPLWQPPEPPPVESTPEPPPPPADDRDTRAANSMIVQASGISSYHDLVAYSGSPAVVVPIQRWKRDGREDLFDRVKAVFSKRLEELKGKQGG